MPSRSFCTLRSLTAFVYNEDHLIKISDTIVSFGTESKLSRSSYFLWYDRVEPELPSHMKFLLRCVGSSKAFQTAVGSILKTTHCKDLIECTKYDRDLNLDLRQKL